MSSPAPETWLILSLGMTILVSFLTLRRWTWWQRVEADAREADDRFRRVFDDNPVGMVLATALLVLLVGMGASVSILRQKPVSFLREQADE